MAIPLESVNENELSTEIAIEEKKRQIQDARLEAERSALAKRRAIRDEEMAGRIALEDKKQKLTASRATNVRTEADAKAYAVAATMHAVEGVDAKVLQALMVGPADPAALIAPAFQGLVANALKYLRAEQRVVGVNPDPDRWDGVCCRFACVIWPA